MSEGPYTNISIKDASNLIHQVSLLFAGEITCLAERCERMLRIAFPDLQANAENSAIAAAVRNQLDLLVARRLLANNTDDRLVSEDDIDDIVDAVLRTGEVPADRDRLSDAAGRAIRSLLMDIMVVGAGNPYVGVWVIAQSLVSTATEQGVSTREALELDNAPDFRDFRAATLRACMTPEGWEVYERLFIESLAMDDTLDSDSWGEIVNISREYFRERGREIWPVTLG